MTMAAPVIVQADLVVVPPFVPNGMMAYAADQWGWTLDELQETLLVRPMLVPYVDKAGHSGTYKSIPPHPVNGSYGPQPSDVLIVGKMPNIEELDNNRLFSQVRGQMWKDYLDQWGVNYQHWVLANSVGWWFDGKTLPASHKREWERMLALTINRVHPKYIMCFGADAMKAVWGLHDATIAKKLSFKNARGTVMEYAGGAKAMVGVHPANVLADPSTAGDFVQDLRGFSRLVAGQTPNPQKKYTVLEVDNEDALKALVDRLIAEDRKIFAIDCEWAGDWTTGQLRTIQIAWSETEGVVVILRRQHMIEAFTPNQHAAISQLARLLYRPGVSIRGHNFRGDNKWLMQYGLDLTDQFICNGFDTMLGYHEVDELSEKQLEVVALKLLGMDRYDLPLRKWLADNGYKKEDFKEQGYGMVPDDILHPYACLHASSLVQLGDGSWKPIGELVKSRYAGFVKTFYDGKVVQRRVTNWHRHAVNQREWFQLRTESSQHNRVGGLHGPAFTPDHKVLTQRGKVAVAELKAGRDRILTDEVEFSPGQLSVFLGSLLGDGGFARKNGCQVGFRFSQRNIRASYAKWKARVFADRNPIHYLRTVGFRSYELPFSRYIASLERRFPTHSKGNHRYRKLILTQDVLDNLGLQGLAVWYQDDGSLVTDKRCRHQSSRIYCRKFNTDEQKLAVDWLTGWFGPGVSYNSKGGFLQIAGSAFVKFHEAMRPYVIHSMAYKFPNNPTAGSPDVEQGVNPFYDLVCEVVPRVFPTSRRGNGVRYCLTVEETGNFLTKAGFVSNCMDAIATWAIAEVIIPEIKRWPGLWEHYVNNVHNTNLPLMEMEMNGVLIDQDRMRGLVDLIAEGLEKLTEKLCKKFNWPDFNPGSSQQVAELVYGHVAFKDGIQTPKRPEGAVCFGLTPIKSTDAPKRSVSWERVMQMPTVDRLKYNPSTDQESIRILAADCPALNEFSQWKTVDQLRKNFLRREEEDDDTGELEWKKGIGSWIGADGRLRTTFRQTLETGRYATSPNLQNWPKKTEKDIRKCFLLQKWIVIRRNGSVVEVYDGVTWQPRTRSDGAFNYNITPQVFSNAREAEFVAEAFGADLEQLLDPRYFSLRSLMMAAPGHVLVEPDWSQAELWTLGACARDNDFLHVLSDPLGDLHTLMMQKMFSSINYQHKPLSGYTIPELNKLRKSDKFLESLRTASKTVDMCQIMN